MKRMRGSITVEAAVIVPLFLGVFALLIHVLFYFHDKNVVTAVAHETLVMKSMDNEIEAEAVENYFCRRLGRKLLLFPGATPKAVVEKEGVTLECKATRKRFKIKIKLQMNRTEPEAYMRKMKRIEEAGEHIGNKIEEKKGQE